MVSKFRHGLSHNMIWTWIRILSKLTGNGREKGSNYSLLGQIKDSFFYTMPKTVTILTGKSQTQNLQLITKNMILLQAWLDYQS